MNILIIGEYSGFAKNLKIGFQQLNHNVVTLSWGDGFKKISPIDSNDFIIDVTNIRIGGFTFRGTARIKSFLCAFTYSKIIDKITKYNTFDVILILNYSFVKNTHEWWKPFVSQDQLFKLIKPNTKVYNLLCGNDLVYNAYLPHMRKVNKGDLIFFKAPSKSDFQVFDFFKENLNHVIPVMYDYASAYRNSELGKKFVMHNTIPLPMEISKINPYNEIKDKIVIFHGINRISKGTDIIIKAMDIIKTKYPEVEVVAKGKMPLAEYLPLLDRANIIIDQCYAFSYGMNAIYAMAKGKVVLSGNEPECQKEFYRTDIPIVNIVPDAEQIASQLENLINNHNLITKISLKSRAFVESFHASDIVAKQYITLFEEFK